ncbi:MAG: hypothetical protein IJ324_10080 [Lachnospiraceae bacterium]|nr:hypothetical protein [Lachnospiraceae bacterium]
MFGYVIVNKAELKFKEYDVYRSYYCGLCHCLRDKYGLKGSATLSYDMTFLLMLLTALYEPEEVCAKCNCVLHPFEKQQYRTSVMGEYVADMNVLLTYLKCLDDWEDDKKLHRLMFSKLLEGKTKDRQKLYMDKVRRIQMLMHTISENEKKNLDDVDAMASLFGQVMGEIVACREDEWTEGLKKLGFYLGEFIYVMDAYEDVEEDIKKGRYNPLKKKYDQPDFEESCRTVLTMMMAECCREFEKLPIIDHADILRNILYSGVWCKYEAIREKRIKGMNGEIKDE